MGNLIVTADIHGSYSAWLTVKTLLKPSDMLVIAGDLFDTRYGNFSNSDFQPETIKTELSGFKQDFFYVYGNCDTASFLPGFKTSVVFTAGGRKILLTHGHKPCNHSIDTDIIIQGHTHLCSLEKKGSHIFMNPGSLTCPRNGIYTYGVIDSGTASLVELKAGNRLLSIDL